MWRVWSALWLPFPGDWAIFSQSRAATKFVPLSDNISLGSRLRLTILQKVLKNESVSRLKAISRWTALVAKQVNRHNYRFCLWNPLPWIVMKKNFACEVEFLRKRVSRNSSYFSRPWLLIWPSLSNHSCKGSTFLVFTSSFRRWRARYPSEKASCWAILSALTSKSSISLDLSSLHFFFATLQLSTKRLTHS